jgi:23S rRNA (adenine2503-C2)-methyltransferase
MESCQRHLAHGQGRRKILFEYVMLKDVNDTLADADELIRLLKTIPSVVNLIPFNPWPGTKYETSTEASIRAFADRLSQHKVNCTIRWPRGRDVMGACGQLASGKAVTEETKTVLMS